MGSYNGIHSSVNYRMRTILRFLLLYTFLVSCLSAPKFHLVETEDEGEEEEKYHSFEDEDEVGSSQDDSFEEEKSADYRFPNGQGSPGWPNGGPKGLPAPKGGSGVPQCPNCG